MLISIFVVLFGLAFGSFLNVCVSRLPRHESVVRPGSRCPRCGVAIRGRDNVPLLSWALLRGRCRGCGQWIAWRYPGIELGTAALFLLSYLRFGLTEKGVGTAVLCFLLLGLAAMDAETMILPDAFTLPGLGLGLVYFALARDGSAADRLAHAGEAALWAVAAGALMIAVRALYFLVRRQEGLGLGDAKLLAMIGAWLGPGLTGLTLFLGVIAAAIYGGVSLASGAREGIRTGSGARGAGARIPLGSFLCAAAIYAVFEGQAALTWYLRFFR